ncbi:MAG: hypothetical protein COU27_01840 [Candidatus Levybacteria bacterium CG10_big_fil_rev_8_21_14_0_10_36_7]|nr:MAG: hypothetical protein COU27_01840 [Candidatus Levybacteria bacterium CG10_big_fil_rev_8_21_14_0_10_36_7]
MVDEAREFGDGVNSEIVGKDFDIIHVAENLSGKNEASLFKGSESMLKMEIDRQGNIQATTTVPRKKTPFAISLAKDYFETLNEHPNISPDLDGTILDSNGVVIIIKENGNFSTVQVDIPKSRFQMMGNPIKPLVNLISGAKEIDKGPVLETINGILPENQKRSGY